MENNKRCYIFYPSSFLGVKKNGRGSSCRVSQHSRFDNRVFAIFRVFIWFAVWLCPCFFRPALAEFDSSDSDNLKWIRDYVGDIRGDTGDILYYITLINERAYNINGILNGLGYSGSTINTGTLKQDINTIKNYLGYGSGSSQASHLTSIVNQTNQIKTALGGDMYNTIADRLDALIDYLENSPSMPTDYATETTLSAFKSKYEDLANQFLTSWGFVGGSDGTFKDLISPWYSIQKPEGYQLSYSLTTFRQTLNATQNPFPVEWSKTPVWSHWFDFSAPQTLNIDRLCRDPFEGLMHYWNNSEMWRQRFEQGLAQKQAANDYYAHTNSVARLDMIFDSLNSTPDVRVDGTDDIGTIAENQLNITFDKATGDSAETIDLQPAFTNDVAELTSPAESVTNKLANLITFSKLSNRYKTPNVDDTNYRDYEITQDIPDYDLQYGTRPQMSFRFTATARNLFRGFLSRERMSTLRSIFLKLWAFLAIYCNFLIFKIFGKMGGNE